VNDRHVDGGAAILYEAGFHGSDGAA